ncbi:DUF1707 SHOCT-like domain-containing protein [Tomitella biformata]|uniref:DUF1707 SHOCT-like domain-containing protein n=1 Tax=Tomitella biformata TaxID=630403 RepID=UPI0004646248|nr:DUF1707 domain-containing protein [Tomitella biformata]
MSDSPEIRIGTDEREQAMAALSGHFSAGRLSLAEFEDRSGLVAQARTYGDLESVFSDLPADRARAPVASPRGQSSPRRSGWEWRTAVVAVMPFVALALFFLTNTWLWFLMIPASGAILYAGGRRHQDPPGELPDHKPEAA